LPVRSCNARPAPLEHGRRTFMQGVALAEIGDKTQLLSFLLARRAWARRSIAEFHGPAPTSRTPLCSSRGDGAAASSAMAAQTKDTAWQKNHPRREQVNNRLANQN